MAAKSLVWANNLLGMNAAALTGGWDLLTPTGIINPSFIIRVMNLSNVDLYLKYGPLGFAHEYIPATTTLNLTFQNNTREGGLTANLARGTKIYVRSVTQAAGVGYIWFASYYQI